MRKWRKTSDRGDCFTTCFAGVPGGSRKQVEQVRQNIKRALRASER